MDCLMSWPVDDIQEGSKLLDSIVFFLWCRLYYKSLAEMYSCVIHEYMPLLPLQIPESI